MTETSKEPTSSQYVPGVAVGIAQRTFWQDVWLRLRRDRLALVGGLIVLALVLVAIMAPWLAPHDPTFQNRDGLTEMGQPLPSSAKYPLGTDNLGRDILSRLIYGARVSLVIGVGSNMLAVAFAVVIGSTAGFLGGRTETVLMRVTDVFMGFPALLLAVALVAVLKPSVAMLILAIALVNWTYLTRIVFGEVQSIASREFVVAARAVGSSNGRILVRHIWPHLVSIIIVYLTLGIATTVMLEATLSYIGIGVPPPSPSWGNMINEGQRYYRAAPWMILFPGLAIIITVLGFNLLGDGLRDALDPRQWVRGTTWDTT